MTILIQRSRMMALGSLMLAVAYGCVVGGGYDGGGDVGVVGYYEPGGYEYGGWGSGYRVGPARGGERRPEQGGHTYRPAAPSRSTPPIATRPRAR
jgi:hypothetical protein